MSRASVSVTKTIFANGGKAVINCYGDFYYFIEASGPISAKTEKSGWIPHSAGTGEIYPRGEIFNRIEILNETDEDIEVTFFVGFDAYIDNRFTVIPGRLSSILFAQDAPTEIIPSEIEVEEDETIPFDGVPPVGYLQRKQIWAIKSTPDGDVWFVDADGNKIIPILEASAGPAFQLDLAGPISVKNFDPATASVIVSQNWFIE